MIKTVATVTGVSRKLTKTGKEFGVVATQDGKEFSSWLEGLTAKAEGLVGQTVEIGYEETQRGQFTNRNLKFIAAASGINSPDTPASHGGTAPQTVEVSATDSNGAGGTVGGGGEHKKDWYNIVAEAARRGEWRAAESLLRRDDINRSVAFNNTITFFQYLKEEDRTPANVKLIFEYMVEAISGR